MFRKFKTEIYLTSMYKMQKKSILSNNLSRKHTIYMYLYVLVFMCALMRIRWISPQPPDLAPGYVDRDLLH